MVRALANLVRTGASRALSLTGHVGRQLPLLKHRFPMKTTFRHCLLVNYAMDPAVLSRSLPRGLTPDTIDTADGPRAFLSVVVADLEAMRPGVLPRALGSDFTQVVYRAIVRAPTGERGVYFVRSDADDVAMSVAGNVFSNFNFHLADCVWSGRDELRDTAARVLDAEGTDQRPEIESRKWLTTPQLQHDEAGNSSSSTGSAAFMLEPRRSGAAEEAVPDPAGVRLSLELASASLTMPSSSAFRGKDVREAQRYFVELYAAFASWPEHDHWSAVRIDRTTWQVVSLEPTSVRQTPLTSTIPAQDFVEIEYNDADGSRESRARWDFDRNIANLRNERTGIWDTGDLR